MLGLTALLFAPVYLSAQSAGTTTTIRNARVVNGSGSAAKQVTVIIRNGRIDAIGENVDAPAGAKIVDASGLTLLPGLIDLHTHLQSSTVTGTPDDLFKNLKKYLAAGVTTVLNFSGQPEAFEPIRKLLKSADYPAPHVYQAARFIPPGGHGTEGGSGLSYEAANPEQAHYLLKEALKYKPDAIKAFTDGWRYSSGSEEPSFNQQTIAAITEEAHKGGIRVFTHTVTLEGAKTAALGNIDAQDHGICDLFADDAVIREYVEPIEGPLGNPDLYKEYPLVLNTGARIQSTFRSQHLNIPGLLRHQPFPEVLIHPTEADARGIVDDEKVYVRTPREKVPFYARVTDTVPRGVVEVNVGGGSPMQADAWRVANANLLTDIDNRDPISGFPVFKALLCQVEGIAAGILSNHDED